MPSNAYLTLVFIVSDLTCISSCYKKKWKELYRVEITAVGDLLIFSLVSLFLKQSTMKKLLNDNYLDFKTEFRKQEIRML